MLPATVVEPALETEALASTANELAVLRLGWVAAACTERENVSIARARSTTSMAETTERVGVRNMGKRIMIFPLFVLLSTFHLNQRDESQ